MENRRLYGHSWVSLATTGGIDIQRCQKCHVERPLKDIKQGAKKCPVAEYSRGIRPPSDTGPRWLPDAVTPDHKAPPQARRRAALSKSGGSVDRRVGERRERTSRQAWPGTRASRRQLLDFDQVALEATTLDLVHAAMLLFEGLASERGIAWRTADSLALRGFLGLGLDEPTPEHSTISRTRRLLDLETHRAVFTWILQVLATADLVKGTPIGIDATTLEATAALRSIVRRDSGETYQEFLTRLAQASGIETPTRADLTRLDRTRIGQVCHAPTELDSTLVAGREHGDALGDTGADQVAGCRGRGLPAVAPRPRQWGVRSGESAPPTSSSGRARSG